MIDVAVIEDPAAAEAALDPARARLLAQLTEPASATMLAAAVGLPRQKVNYHLRTLERHGLVELVEERRKGNVTERLLRATAASYVISPAALAAVAPDPARAPDRLSARWLLALAAQLVRDVGDLHHRAPDGRSRSWPRSPWTARCGSRPPPTGPPSPRSCTSAVTSLVAKYHDEQARPAAASTAWSSPSTPASRPADDDPDRGGLNRWAGRFEQPQRRRGAGEPGRGLGRDRHRAGDRLLVHGPQRGRARTAAARSAPSSASTRRSWTSPRGTGRGGSPTAAARRRTAGSSPTSS